MATSVSLTECTVIADNRAWLFGVARWGDRWVGWATARGPAGAVRLIEILPEVSEAYRLGLEDRAEAIRLTSAVAADPESHYGSPDRWHIADEERGDPEDYRCPACGRVGCDGMECDDEC